jgi:hypothetical protein
MTPIVDHRGLSLERWICTLSAVRELVAAGVDYLELAPDGWMHSPLHHWPPDPLFIGALEREVLGALGRRPDDEESDSQREEARKARERRAEIEARLDLAESSRPASGMVGIRRRPHWLLPTEDDEVTS